MADKLIEYQGDTVMADDGPPGRKRARQACLACNARRVKCNVTESRPCQNCIAAGVACETRESRRGKHPRPSKKRQSEDSSIQPFSGGHSQHADEVAASHVLASLHRNRPSDNFSQNLPGVGSLADAERQPSPHQNPRQEEDGDVFLGESTALRYVHDEPTSTPQSGPSPSHGVRFRHSVPNAVKADALIPEWEAERRRNRIEFLRNNGAFSSPSSAVVEGLLKAYFFWFHPCFAVVDELDVWNQHRRRNLSPLLLQAILFVGVLHCDEVTLLDLGFGTRHKAKYIFYNRAKDIYDAEYETKQLTVIQALFLMSFWRAGALLEKDTRHWLGAAITLAQTKALHRSAGKAETQLAKLRKRIWWSLYTRDRQCAAALGLPNRVRDEDCDSEPLLSDDFEHAFHPGTSRKEAAEYASHAVGMTDLAKLLGKIVHSGYLPNKTLTGSHRSQMREELVRWKLRLPPAMQPDSDLEEQPGFHANMQHLAYNNLLILLYRQGFIGTEDESREVDGNIALQAAARNSRIIEDMLSDGNLRHAQVHVITNLFNTLCVHTVHLRQSTGTTKTVAESRANLCLLGLRELQKTWEVTNWVLQLFFQYLDHATAARLRVQQDESAGNTGVRTSREQSQVPQFPQPQATPDPAPRTRPSNAIPESNFVQNVAEAATAGTTPWSWWTSEEANSFLFSQIENEFAFGEGEMLNWSPGEDAYSNVLLQPIEIGTNFMS